MSSTATAGVARTKSFSVDPRKIGEVLGKMNSESSKQANGDICVRECSLCDKGNKSKPDNQWKLIVRPDGSYYCYRCSLSGSWNTLQKLVSGDKVSIRSIESEDSPKVSNVFPNQAQAYAYTKMLFPDDETSAPPTQQTQDNQQPRSVAEVRRYLVEERGLSRGILMQYGVGYGTQKFLNAAGKWEENACVTFPWIMPGGPDRIKEMSQKDDSRSEFSDDGGNPTDSEELTDGNSSSNDGESTPSFAVHRIKFRSVETKGRQRLHPKGGPWGFFGWHTVQPDDDTIVITEGEYDAMAVAAALQSLPSQDPLKYVCKYALIGDAYTTVLYLHSFSLLYFLLFSSSSRLQT